MKRGCRGAVALSMTGIVLLMATSALGRDKTPSPSSPEGGASIQSNCDLRDYTSASQTRVPPDTIPDGVPSGVTVGPIVLSSNGDVIGDVVIELQMTHTYIGDLRILVSYDEGADGTMNASSVLMCQPGRNTCPSTGPDCDANQVCTYGCSDNLICSNEYLIDDTGQTGLGLSQWDTCTDTPAGIVPGGCYKPVTPLSVFEGLNRGGRWFLTVEDHEPADNGVICGWAVHVLGSSPTSVSRTSWGRIKTFYR